MASKSELQIVLKAKDEASKDINKTKLSLEGLGSGLKTTGLGAVAFGTAAVASAGAMAVSAIKDYSRVGDEVEKMSKRTGLGAEAISGLRVAADMGGTSIDTVENAIKKMQLNMDTMAASSPDLVNQLETIGFSFDDIRKMSPEKQFETLGNAVAMVEDPLQRTNIAVAAFGKAGTELVPMFEDGNFAMDSWIGQAEQLGVKFDDLSATKAAALNDSLGAMETAFNGLKLKIGGELAPIVTDLILNRFLPLVNSVLDALPTMDQLKTSFDNIKTNFQSTMDSFEEKTHLISQIKDAFASIWKVLTEELMPALKDLWVAMEPLWPYLEGFAKMIGFVLVVALKIFVEVLRIIIELAVKIITKMVEWSTTVLDVLKPAMEVMTDIFNGIADGIQRVIQKFHDMKEAAVNAFNSARDAVGNIPLIGGALSGRASGGPVSGGTPYIVGERGPELFVPSNNGSIVPNNKMGGGTGITVNLSVGTVQKEADEQRLAQSIAQTLARTLQSQRYGLSTQL